MREHFYSFIFFFLCSEHQHRTKNVCSSKTMTSLRTELSVDPLKNQLKQQNIKKNNITRYKRELFFKGRLLRLLVFLQSWRVSEQSIQIAFFHKNTNKKWRNPKKRCEKSVKKNCPLDLLENVCRLKRRMLGVDLV